MNKQYKKTRQVWQNLNSYIHCNRVDRSLHILYTYIKISMRIVFRILKGTEWMENVLKNKWKNWTTFTVKKKKKKPIMGIYTLFSNRTTSLLIKSFHLNCFCPWFRRPLLTIAKYEMPIQHLLGAIVLRRQRHLTLSFFLNIQNVFFRTIIIVLRITVPPCSTNEWH